MGLLTGTVQNWLAVQNVIRILVTIYIQNLLPACRPIFKAVRGTLRYLPCTGRYGCAACSCSAERGVYIVRAS
jgi:hypothetical protein